MSTTLDHITPSRDGSVRLATAHSLWDGQSLQWDWSGGESLLFSQPFALRWRFRVDGVVYAPVFVLNVYNKTPLDDPLRIEVGGAWFTFGLNFTGWRAATVRYHGDMQGEIPEASDGFRILAPAAGSGTLWLNGIQPAGCIYEALPMPDAQVPFVADGRNEHLGPGAQRSHLSMMALQPPSAEASPVAATIINSMEQRLLSEASPSAENALASLSKLFSESTSNIQNPTPNAQGEHPHSGVGCWALDVGCPGPTIRSSVQMSFTDTPPAYTQPREAGVILKQLALSYRHHGSEDCRQGYLALTRHLIDQGWVSGSCLGSLHLLGYALAELCEAHFLMRDVLAEEGLLETVTLAMQWLTNARECALMPPDCCDLDWLHTFAETQLMSLLMTSDEAGRAGWVTAFSRFLNASLAMQTDDVMDGFKWDGGAFHHYGHYPAYAAGAVLHTAALMQLFEHTPYALSQEAQGNVRRSIAAMRVSIMGDDLPMGLSGRHPFRQSDWMKEIHRAAEIFKCDPPPECCFRPMNTAAAATHRRPGWLVAIRGFSKYVWSTEVFPGSANRYGAFQGHGSVEILRDGGQAASGYKPDGWDWRHVPGATTCRTPLPTLLDKGSCLRSRETFAGTVTLDGLNGHFAFCLSNDFFQLSARKSVFCFDNEIVCLGSDITCWRQNHETVTTLFQNAIGDEAIACKPQPGDAGHLLRDAVGNSYWLDQVETLRVHVGEQSSRDQCTTDPTAGRFATAWLDHGRRPKSASYAYRIMVQSDAAPTTIIHQHDRHAHIVHHPGTGITAFALFEPGPAPKLINHQSSIINASKPCLVQLRSADEGLELAICDPDLQWGRERCDVLTISVHGAWEFVANDDLLEAHLDGGQTRVFIQTTHGRPVHLRAQRRLQG